VVLVVVYRCVCKVGCGCGVCGDGFGWGLCDLVRCGMWGMRDCMCRLLVWMGRAECFEEGCVVLFVADGRMRGEWYGCSVCEDGVVLGHWQL
jgi:hypothetical protein